MFADNEKISKRQITRLLIYDVFGISTLILPQKLAQTAGNLGILSMMIAAILVYMYLEAFGRMQHGMRMDLSSYLSGGNGDRKGVSTSIWTKIVCKILQLLYLCLFVGIAGYTVAVFTEVMHRFLLNGESFLVIAGTILILAGYGIVQGIEGRARVYELLFWFLLVPLIIMLLLAIRDINPSYYQGAISTDADGLVCGTGMSITCFMLLYFAGLLGRFEQKKGEAIAGAKSALVVVLVLNLVIYVILVGVFGRNALGNMESPVLVLMSMVKLPGGFLKRQDAFMVAIWFFTLYALINSSLFHGNEMLKNLIGKRGNKRYIIITLLLVYCVAKVWYDNCWQIERYRTWFVVAALILVLVVPPIIYLIDKGGSRREEKK